MSVTNRSVLRKRSGVVSRSLDDARIALRLDSSETLVFNQSADRLWDLFNGQHTVASVASATGHPPEVVAVFASQLIELGLFEVVDSPAAEEVAPAQATSSVAPGEGLVAPQLVSREELAVLGGCTSSGLTCSFPASGAGAPGRPGRQPPGPPPR